MKKRINTCRGHTLLELLTAMFVMAILVAAAIPFYDQYIIKGKIDAIKNTILLTATAEDRYFSTHKQYGDTGILDDAGLMVDVLASMPKNINHSEIGIHALPAMTTTHGWSYAVLMTMNIDSGNGQGECWVYFSANHPSPYSGQMMRLYDDVKDVVTAPAGYDTCASCPPTTNCALTSGG